MKRAAPAAALVLALAAAAVNAEENPPPTAWFKALDKISGRVSDLPVAVGATASFGTLDIRVSSCSAAPPEERPESFVFVEVFDRARPASGSRQGARIFSGWMFASSPAVHPLEHPVYDLWPVKCTTAAGSAPSGKE